MSQDQPRGPAVSLHPLDKSTVRKHWRLFLFEGVILVLGGFAAVALPWIASLAFTIFLGWLFLIVGVVGLATTLMMKRHATGFWWSILSGVLAIVAGALLLGWPAKGLLSLTIVLIIFFAVEGVSSVFYALEHRRAMSGRWEWMLASGLIDLVLAAIIFGGFPFSAVWALGMIVGIDMVFGGIALGGMALRARESGTGTALPPGQHAPHAG